MLVVILYIYVTCSTFFCGLSPATRYYFNTVCLCSVVAYSRIPEWERGSGCDGRGAVVLARVEVGHLPYFRSSLPRLVDSDDHNTDAGGGTHGHGPSRLNEH